MSVVNLMIRSYEKEPRKEDQATPHIRSQGAWST
jgi:hypothetical protein